MILAQSISPSLPIILACLLGAAAILLLWWNYRLVEGLRQSTRAALNALTDGVVVLSEEPDRVYCNDAAAQMLALAPDFDLPRRHYRISRSHLLGEIVRDALVTPEARLPALEMVDIDGRFRSFQRTTIRIRLGRATKTGVILQDRTELKTLSHLLEESRRRDPLTGLATPEALHDRTGQAIEQAARAHGSVALLVIEIDQFSELFDSQGWASASALLIQASVAISGVVRAMDLMARVGQNRFAVLLTGIGDPAALPLIAERFLAAARFRFGEEGTPITGSIGIARAGIDGATSLRLLEKASHACRQARAEGGDRARFFDAQADELPPLDSGLVHELRRAIEQGEFFMRYQPIVALRGRRTCGYEALLRWNHPERGEILPGEFIATAERSGLIHALGDFALRRACIDAAGWPETCQVSINLSVVELMRGDVPRRILAALADAELPPDRLRVELTESARIPDLGRLRTAIDEIRTLGVTVALDDFGTGHSSLTHLQSLTFDALKIDGRFIGDLGNPRSAGMIRMLIAYCRQIGVSVVAEGVETEAQAAMLAGMGCSHAQGFLFGRPAPSEALIGWVLPDGRLGSLPDPAL